MKRAYFFKNLFFIKKKLFFVFTILQFFFKCRKQDYFLKAIVLFMFFPFSYATSGECADFFSKESVKEEFVKEELVEKGEKQFLEEILRKSRKKSKRKNWMPYTEAKVYIQSQGIKTAGEFQDWRMLSDKRPKNFPSNPSRSYQTQWKSWGDFLGTINLKGNQKNWMDYESAKNYIQAQGIKTKGEFGRWAKSDKRPKNFPSSPNRSYQTQWRGWRYFLGTQWANYQEVKIYVRALGLKNREEYRNLVRNGENLSIKIPIAPDVTYKLEWEGWSEFLGNYKWMSYKKARAYARKMGIQNNKDFVNWLNSDERPRNFPKNPHKHYSEWKSVEDFLRIKWMPYRKAKSYVQSINIETQKEFFEWILSGKDQLEDFPSNPNKVYKEWEGWNEFLGVNQESRVIFQKKFEGSFDQNVEKWDEDFLYMD